MSLLNETHDPALTSWVASANSAFSDFPIQNLPFAVFRRESQGEAFRGGVAIGDKVVDLGLVVGLLDGLAAEAAKAGSASSLNSLMALGPEAWSALRLALSRALRRGAVQQSSFEGLLVEQADVEYMIPAQIGDYTDFYTSIYHATNVGLLFRPSNPLMPNYRWIPIGYHGRASSIGVSGQTFPRPSGQTFASDSTTPILGPSKRLDYELELAIYIGTGNEQGHAVSIDKAESHVFGVSLLNDWSARDIQAWEYQPLGPFLAKSFASTVSPWIVTLEALTPFRLPFTRPEGDPQPLAYLDSSQQREEGAFDIQLELYIESVKHRTEKKPAARVSCTSYRHAYWTIGQMVTHHTVNGCNLRPGDLLGTGTLSGPTRDQAGALLEITSGGKEPIDLGNGETRTFLEDGDTVVIRGWCERHGAARIGFGECRGTVMPAVC